MYARLRHLERELAALASRRELSHLAGADLAVVYSPVEGRTLARIWGLHRIFQHLLDIRPLYVIELMRPFKSLSCDERARTLAHELAHIPYTASGAVRPHNRAFRRDFKRYVNIVTCDALPSLKSL